MSSCDQLRAQMLALEPVPVACCTPHIMHPHGFWLAWGRSTCTAVFWVSCNRHPLHPWTGPPALRHCTALHCQWQLQWLWSITWSEGMHADGLSNAAGSWCAAGLDAPRHTQLNRACVHTLVALVAKHWPIGTCSAHLWWCDGLQIMPLRAFLPAKRAIAIEKTPQGIREAVTGPVMTRHSTRLLAATVPLAIQPFRKG